MESRLGLCRTMFLIVAARAGLVFFYGLQLWQSLNCASNVIVRQRDQKERSVTKKQKTRQQNPQKHPTNKHQNQTTNPSLTNRVKGETRWNKLRLSRKLQSPALTTSSAGNSQRPMQCVVTQQQYHHRLASSSFSSSWIHLADCGWIEEIWLVLPLGLGHTCP